MQRIGFAMLMLCLAGGAFGQAQEPICVLHIESPEYDPLTHVAHITGSVKLTITIGSDGAVVDVDGSGPPMLVKPATQNIRLWTFNKPAYAPYTHTMVFEYKIEGPASCDVVPGKVSFDLPGRVTISARPWQTCDPVSEPAKKKH